MNRLVAFQWGNDCHLISLKVRLNYEDDIEIFFSAGFGDEFEYFTFGG